MSILSIDAGTTGVTALIISGSGEILSRGYTEFEQHFPQPGWVEHDPEQIWQATLSSVKSAVQGHSEKPTCIGITNQRETAVIWDRETLSSPTEAIVWQDRRTSVFTEEPQASGTHTASTPRRSASSTNLTSSSEDMSTAMATRMCGTIRP